MVRNALQMWDRVLELCDRTKNRYSDRAVIDSINEAIELTITKRIEPVKTGEKYSVQYTQRLREELSALIPVPVEDAVTGGVALYPEDYKYLLSLYVSVSGAWVYCKPTTYGQEGELNLDPFAKPSSEDIYFNELNTGLRIICGADITLTNFRLYYIKNPTIVSFGQERDKKIATNALTNAVVYYVYEEAVYAATTYYVGETITGTGAALTSGIVIPASVVASSELSSTLQDEICNLSAAILSGQIEDYNKKQSLSNDADKY
jgi:hypothetical protein